MTDIQTDTRIGTIEVKIKKLDAELGAFKTQMSKLRDGPGKVRLILIPSESRGIRDLAHRQGGLIRRPVVSLLQWSLRNKTSAAISSIIISSLHRAELIYIECNSTTGTSNIKAKKNV